MFSRSERRVLGVRAVRVGACPGRGGLGEGGPGGGPGVGSQRLKPRSGALKGGPRRVGGARRGGEGGSEEGGVLPKRVECSRRGWSAPEEGEATKRVKLPKGGAPEGWGPPLPGFWVWVFGLLGLRENVAQNFAFFCLKRQGPQMCTFGVLGLSCEISAGRLGFKHH